MLRPPNGLNLCCSCDITKYPSQQMNFSA
uniref:Uncharacterized protein n=1 Tax=Anguilla anguilla TaxID=7936 RepID=A0A0E9QVN1_ANGAN